MKSALWLLLFLALTLATRVWNHADVFVEGNIFFVDADCYSRMTRARMVFEQPGTVVRFHDFENYPHGVSPHTTAPMDYLIASLAWMLKPWSGQPLDLAGAVVSPLLGMLTTAFLWFWSLELIQRFRKLMLTLVSLSPMLAQGTLLGRPDHQSLLIFLLTVGICAQLSMAKNPVRGWSIVSGLAWGLALWVSLYEPLVIGATVIGTQLLFFRPSVMARERLWGLGAGVATVGMALLIERWHVQIPDATTQTYFARWRETVGELSSVSVLSPLLFRWVGFGLLVAPVLLIARLRDARRSIILLVLFAVTFSLTLMQVRWGYFFALVFALSLPWQLSPFINRRLMVTVLFMASLWPILREWEEKVFPNEARQAERLAQRREAFWLRDAAEHLRANAVQPILAPWWLSPPLAYWSRQPAVAGSSHESLAGSADSARFYLAGSPAAAADVLRHRPAAFVLADMPERVLDTSAVLLGRVPAPSALASVLYERPHSAPDFLKLVHANPVFKIYAVGELPP